MEAYQHLRIEREQPINQTRPRKSYGIKPPTDIAGHGKHLYETFKKTKEKVQEYISGYDDRYLFKLQLQGLSSDALENIPGVELVSEEEGGYALAFADESALEEFEARLVKLSTGEPPTRKEIFYALRGFDNWTTDDRTGWALKKYGRPVRDSFIIDVELWPLSRSDERTRITDSFKEWLLQNTIRILDSINVDSLILYRVFVDEQQTDLLLQHRDVRTVDLPPQFGLDPNLLTLDIQDTTAVPSPPEEAPVIAVLDSGIAGGHPFISPALGDAQGFVNPDREQHDDNGHGTHVTGIALYGNVEECARARSFVPYLRIVSGRILDPKAESDLRFIENIIAEAVRYFHREYNCRIFNISYGDLNKPYMGGHVKGLAYMLDCLSRELNVLFVVPAGNFHGVDGCPGDWKREYPEYLFSEHARLIDPAPALNVLTVGSIARWDQDHYAQRHTTDPRQIPIAQVEQPSPFTRCGYSVKKAIKPDIVAFGGNLSLHQITGHVSQHLLGELSLNKDFVTSGRLLAERTGTSYAAPHITHYAGNLLSEIPDASANLLRAVLVAHAEVPQATFDLLEGDRGKICQAVGYGMICPDTLYRSVEEDTTLIAEEEIENNRHHFYEIPTPDSFYQPGKRKRIITVALAHSPLVRTTRIDYKASKIEFRLVESESLDKLVNTFNAATTKDEFPNIAELNVAQTHKNKYRSKGTVQQSTWTIKQSRENRNRKIFLVITRKDATWGINATSEKEPYALAVRISDKENMSTRLYTEIRAQLQARERVRQRLRT